MVSVGIFYDHRGIFYDHLEYFMAIWYNLWPFGIVYIWSCGLFLECLDQEKSGNPGRNLCMYVKAKMFGRK
jgi:hypothetical protein